jgi:putative two-component system response regulator
MVNKQTVLIIDDVPMSIYALSQMLIPLYTVKVAKDGDLGLKLASDNKIDLILLDVYMPEISGLEVLVKLKESEKTRDIPVMIISGSEESEDEQQGLSLGAVDFIKKPYKSEDVLQKVKEYISWGGRNA